MNTPLAILVLAACASQPPPDRPHARAPCAAKRAAPLPPPGGACAQSSDAADAGEISGYVVATNSAGDKQGIGGATIVALLEASPTGCFVTESDGEGHYALRVPPGTYYLLQVLPQGRARSNVLVQSGKTTGVIVPYDSYHFSGSTP